MKKQLFLFCSILLATSSFSFGQKTGDDRDEHGCIASAGYTYSLIKKTCVRVFEQKIQLKEVNPKGTSTSIAAVIFSEDNKKAEVFLPGLTPSQILVRKGTRDNYIWKKGGLVLSKKNGYELKKDGKLIFSGQ